MKQTIRQNNTQSIPKKVEQLSNKKSKKQHRHKQNDNDLNSTHSIDRKYLQKKRAAVERHFNKSVVNKIYIFPREKESYDQMSVSRWQSIHEMQFIQTYRLIDQNKKIKKQSTSILSARYPQTLHKRVESSKHIDKKLLKNSHQKHSQKPIDAVYLNQSKSSINTQRIQIFKNVSCIIVPNCKQKTTLTQAYSKNTVRKIQKKKQVRQKNDQSNLSLASNQSNFTFKNNYKSTFKQRPKKQRPNNSSKQALTSIISNIIEKFRQNKKINKSKTQF